MGRAKNMNIVGQREEAEAEKQGEVVIVLFCRYPTILNWLYAVLCFPPRPFDISPFFIAQSGGTKTTFLLSLCW